MKEREARLIKISVANVKFTDARGEKHHAGSAACLPKKPPNIAYVPSEYQRHKSKKSIKENYNHNNFYEECCLYTQEKKRQTSKPRSIHLSRKPKVRVRHAEQPSNQSTHEHYMLKTNERSISIKVQYETLRTEGSVALREMPSERNQFVVAESSELMCDEQIGASRRESFVRKPRKNSVSSTALSYTKEVSTARLSVHDQIRLFERREAEFQMEFERHRLQYLIDRQNIYIALPHFNCYLDKYHQYINWTKRAVLINWMMEVLNDYSGKRDTLYIAVSMVDRFLCLSANFPVARLQLVGITALYVASKLEQQLKPSVESFAETTGGEFSENDIVEFEEELLQKLQWLVNPPNLNTWCNRMSSQWDVFVQKDPSRVPKRELCELMLFKNSDEKSYYNFRWLVQLLDLALLDCHTLQYKSRTLVASFMYVLLGLRTQLFRVEDVLESFPRTSKYIFDEENWLNDLFNEFVSSEFGFLLADLLPSIQYCSTYFLLPLSFELPTRMRNCDGEVVYEEFCSYQTVNKSNILCLLKRNRSYD